MLKRISINRNAAALFFALWPTCRAARLPVDVGCVGRKWTPPSLTCNEQTRGVSHPALLPRLVDRTPD